MTLDEELQYLAAVHNDVNMHYWDNDAECVFCGAFGPVDGGDPCVDRKRIGRQVAFLISKLHRIRSAVVEGYRHNSLNVIYHIIHETFVEDVPCTSSTGHLLEGGWCSICGAVYNYPGWGGGVT